MKSLEALAKIAFGPISAVENLMRDDITHADSGSLSSQHPPMKKGPPKRSISNLMTSSVRQRDLLYQPSYSSGNHRQDRPIYPYRYAGWC